ncbi:MAG: hypothetical protein AB1571_01745 [Nanoarchaeota archaeon]
MFDLLSFTGLLIGVLLAKLSPEEVKPGKKYFIILKKLVLLSIIITLVYYTKFLFLSFFIGVLFAYFFNYAYLYLGLSLIVSVISKQFNLLIASFIFIYGLPYGTLLNKNILKKTVLYLLLFLAPLLLIINNLNIIYTNIISSFVVGSIAVLIIKNDP